MEARSMGKFLASVAIECKSYRRPTPSPRALIIGGETTVEVKGEGIGGRIQETALSAAEDIAGVKGIVIASLGTDGIDGNSKAAGAMVDGDTVFRAKRQQMNPHDFLERNDSYRFFRRLSDNLVTGPTGTNVGDLYLVVSADSDII
jgi:glycerate-2-kinase